MAAGAASLSDSSIRSVGVVHVLLVVAGGRTLSSISVAVVAVVATTGLGRALDTRHEVAEDLLGDQQGVLELDDGLGGGLEQDDLVRALAVPVDRVGQSTATPRGDLHDLATGGHDLAGRAIDDGLAAIVRHVGRDHEHQFITAHARRHSFQWGMPR